MKLTIQPLTPGRWNDVEALFGERGACGGCWCMWWKQARPDFEKNKGENNKKAFQGIVRSGRVPGLLAYDGKTPVGWCAVEPRENYIVLRRSRSLKPIDETPVWSVTCFFIRRDYRKHGVSVHLLEAAKRYVASRGGSVMEGYPVEPKSGSMPDTFAYHGLVSGFETAGFTEVARPSRTRAIMRCTLTKKTKKRNGLAGRASLPALRTNEK